MDIPGPPPRAPRKEDRALTDYEKQLLREIQDLKNRQEMMVAPAPPPPKYSDSVENWQKSFETLACGGSLLKERTNKIFLFSPWSLCVMRGILSCPWRNGNAIKPFANS